MDYDVKAAALASPPTSAPVQSYRPAVAVQNLGIHDADVTGTLRVYDRAAGTLLVTFLLAANDIKPGETRNATASGLWEPTAADIGKSFIFIASIVYPPDQFLPNNNLAPVIVTVTAAPPTPPPPVEAHADQHEDGGGDELDVDGLTGKLAEAQTPTDHANQHEVDGEDVIDVAGLTGELATPQTPKTHAASHNIGGSDPVTLATPGPHAETHSPEGGDEIDVTGLPGLLADPQTAVAHKATHQEGGDDQLSVQGLAGQLAEAQPPVAHHAEHQLAGADAMVGLYYNHDTLHLGIGTMTPVVLPGYTQVSILEHTFPTPLKKALILAAVEIALPPNQPAAATALMRLRVNGDLDTYFAQVSQQAPESYVISQAVVMDYRNLNAAATVWSIEVLCELIDLPYNATLNALHVIPLE